MALEKNIWDNFGRWDEYAKLEKVEDVKAKISGYRVWVPNFVSPALQYIMQHAADGFRAAAPGGVATVVDFGCGLGRNGPMLARHFPRVVGADLPEMIARVKSEFPGLLLKGGPYSALYGSVSDLTASENFCALYDSVVLQHITDYDYVYNTLELLSRTPTFGTIVSVYYKGDGRPVFLDVLKKLGWNVWHSEVEALSFEGVPHYAVAFTRPVGPSRNT